MNLKSFGQVLVQSAREWSDDNAPRVGAALAFYAIFAIAPLLVICTAIAGLVFGEEAARGQIVQQVSEFVGQEGALALQSMVADAAKPRSGLFATVAGIGMMLVGAIGLFSELQAALNTIWNVKPRSDRGWIDFARDRVLSFVMVLVLAGILLAMLIGSAVLSALTAPLGESSVAYLGPIGNSVLILLIMTLAFGVIYRYLPDAKIAWNDVWLGAFITALLFSGGNYAIGLYLGKSAVSSAYGAAGSLAVLLLWLYYAAQVFLAGAEITQVYAKWHGSGIIPSDNAQLAQKPQVSKPQN